MLVFALQLQVVDELQLLEQLLDGLRYRGTVAIVVCTATGCWVHTHWTELPVKTLQTDLCQLWRKCSPAELTEQALVAGVTKALKLLQSHVLSAWQHSRVVVVRRPRILLIEEELASGWAAIIQQMAADDVLLAFFHQHALSETVSQESQVASEEIYAELSMLPDASSVLVEFREDRHDLSCLCAVQCTAADRCGLKV